MLDYHTHIAGLATSTARLANLVTSGGTSGQLKLLQAVNAAPSYATLGSLTDRLFEHAGPSDLELHRLQTGSEIWKQISDFTGQVADIRVTLESLVSGPNQPNALDKFNAIATQLQDTLKPQFSLLVGRLQAYYNTLADLKHVTQHGQAQDQPVNAWSWRDVILSRRTGAFTRNISLVAVQDGSPEAASFAFGALASYASNVIGSAYLNRVVGGPRRSHPHRDRLASYTMGAWFQQHHPNLTVSLKQLRASLSFGAPTAPGLPPSIMHLLEKAITKTYGSLNFGASPDLQAAYKNLVKHLDLLTSFPTLPLPQPIDNSLQAKITPLHPLSGPGGEAPVGTAQSPITGSGPSSNSRPWWEWVLFVACVVLIALGYLIGILGSPKKDPFPGPFQHTGEGESALQSYLGSNDALISVYVMFNIHCQLYAAADTALKVMKFLGMVYPDPIDLGEAQFSQFLTIPSVQAALKRQVANKDKFLMFPQTADEHPNALIAPFPPGADPGVLLTGLAVPTIGSYTIRLLGDGLGAQSSALDDENLNLDADRGFEHACWKIKDGASISNDPVPVQVLAYNAV